MLFWTFNFFANPNIQYLYNVHNFPFNFHNYGYTIFILNQTFRLYNVHYFQSNLRNSRQSIYLPNQTFRTYDIHNSPLNFHKSRDSISLQIQKFRKYTINLRRSIQSNFLQIQTFCTSIMYTIFFQIYAVLDVKFFCKSRHSIRILYTISR